MSWTHDYHPAARWTLLNALPRSVGARLDAAVIRLAETEVGPVEQIEPDDPNAFRLRVEGAAAELRIDRAARTLFVIRVYRCR